MKHILSITSLILLTACTSYKEGFDCEAIPGAGCKSIAEVDHMIDQGKLGTNNNSSPEGLPQSDLKGNNKLLERKRGVHVWIAPYSDEDGIAYGAQNLFVPLNPHPEGAE